MKIRKRFNFRGAFALFYVLAFAVYIVIGLQPAEAAKNYPVATNLTIPSIDLETGVTKLHFDGGTLDTPDTIVGSYSEANNKTLLIGHSGTVFQNLKNVKIGDIIIYDGKTYEVKIERLAAKEVIDMSEILMPAKKDTIVIMTCDGKTLGNGDATHRFIVTAVKI